MQIYYREAGTFVLEVGKGVLVAFEPHVNFKEAVTVATFSSGKNLSVEARKSFSLPGEYEVAGVLFRALYTDERKNVVFKVTAQDMAIAYFGNLQEIPEASFFEELGENVSVALLNMTGVFDAKKAKIFLEKVAPRYVLVSGEKALCEELKQTLGAKETDGTPLTLTKASLVEDKMDVILF